VKESQKNINSTYLVDREGKTRPSMPVPAPPALGDQGNASHRSRRCLGASGRLSLQPRNLFLLPTLAICRAWVTKMLERSNQESWWRFRGGIDNACRFNSCDTILDDGLQFPAFSLAWVGNFGQMAGSGRPVEWDVECSAR
jgi:hypothetical protein